MSPIGGENKAVEPATMARLLDLPKREEEGSNDKNLPLVLFIYEDTGDKLCPFWVGA